MILLLGKNDAVEKYAEETLKIDMGNDIAYYPDYKVHHTEFKKYIDIARDEEPPVITTQNNEMIDVLLSSDLDLEVIRVREYNNKICVAKHTKEEAWDLRQEYEMELR